MNAKQRTLKYQKSV